MVRGIVLEKSYHRMMSTHFVLKVRYENSDYSLHGRGRGNEYKVGEASDFCLVTQVKGDNEMREFLELGCW